MSSRSSPNKDYEEVYQRLSQHVTPEKSHQLEQLELERIRRIKEFEEKYLKLKDEKYGQLKKRRSEAYQSEKEIAKYKRDYAVAKQKLWEARMQLLDNMYQYNMGSHTVPLKVDSSMDEPSTSGPVPLAPQFEQPPGEEHGPRDSLGEGQDLDLEGSESGSVRGGYRTDGLSGPSGRRLSVSPAKVGEVGTEAVKGMGSFLRRRGRVAARLIKWGLSGVLQVIEDVSTCSDYVVAVSVKAVKGAARLVNAGAEKMQGSSAPRPSPRRNVPRPSPRPSHRSRKSPEKRGNMFRTGCYALGIVFVYVVHDNVSRRNNKLEKRLQRLTSKRNTAVPVRRKREDESADVKKQLKPEAIVLTTEINKTARRGRG
ncbi:hypothetical protein HOP50_18g81820 [Chloropicon primus]|uniref:Uncharacterized protein n=1 Tax=Chloropicon primus TaxID=1764295 RepID=A0A5B8N1D9_9CHLO|nr:hypothetical protein A3770_18p81580 [Chloropicon primus]UPR04837.1 hypothetical protein HOP50_18g81820 [Chloropicon primus]|eukprot:QDZ25640.1 hypothetical protein A3770_18p81580 [Chloropicon primus]